MKKTILVFFLLALATLALAEQNTAQGTDTTKTITHVDSVLAKADSLLGEYKLDEAYELYNSVRDSIVESGEKEKIWSLYHIFGAVYYYGSQYDSALFYWESALNIGKIMKDKEKILRNLGNIGIVYMDIAVNNADYDNAISYHEQAIEIAREIGDKNVEINLLNSIGIIFYRLYKHDKSILYHQQALKIAREIGDRRREGGILGNIGNNYINLGNYDKSLSYQQQALNISREFGDRKLEGNSLGNIALTYLDLGEYDKALSYSQQTLEIAKEIGNRILEGNSLSYTATAYNKFGKYDKALLYYQQRLEIARVTGNRIEESRALGNIGIVYGNLGEYDKALSYLQETGSEAPIWLHGIGFIYRKCGDYVNALEYSNKALVAFKRIGAEEWIRQSYTDIADIYLEAGQLCDALANYEKAIEIAESIRSKLVSSEQKMGYFAQVVGMYTSAFDVSYDLYEQTGDISYLENGFRYLESSRSRALLDQLAEAKGNLREGVPDSLLDKEHSAMSRLGWLAEKLTGEKSKREEEQDTLRIAEWDSELMGKEEELDRLRVTMIKVSPRYADLQYPEPMTLEQVQNGLLDDETALLEYITAGSFAYLYCVTKDTFAIYKIPGNIETRPVVELMRNTLSSSGGAFGNFVSASSALYENCLKPAEALFKDKPILLISGDGPFSYIPFEVLLTDTTGSDWTDAPYLVAAKSIHYTPSATILYQNHIHPKEYAGERLAFVGFGDPVYDSEREYLVEDSSSVSTEQLAMRSAFGDSTRRGFERLPYTSEEIEAIAGLLGKKQSAFYLREDASENNAKNEDLSPYRYVHFACHGVFNEHKPSYSGLMLTSDSTDNGFLQMYEIYNLDLNADLIALSCQTGIGVDVSGEGLIGLTRAFMYAGTPAVLVSLWSINDASTSEFMTGFYSKLKKNGRMEALRKTQQSFIESGEYSHPFYWAPFILMGEK